MKIFRILLLLPAFLLISGSGYSQAWLKDIAGTKKANGQELNFYDIQNAFNTYWDGKTVEKGKGFKQFRRWEYFMEPRVYPSGNLNLPGLWKAYDEIQSAQKTEVNNSAWTSLGPFLIPEKASGKNKAGMGRINCIAFHPSNANIFYVGSPSGGIWKTTNGGQTWSTSSDNLLSIGVSDIAINPSDPNIVYIATGDGDAGDTYGIGVLKSTNGGTSWNATALSLEQSQSTSFRRILINPVNPNILLACSTTGIYRSDDGFATFKIVQYGNFKDMEFKPDDPNVVYAASYASDGSAKVYVSSDGGNTFAQSKTGLLIDGKVNRVELAVTPASPGYVFALCSDSNNDGFYALYRSTDAAGKWTKIYPNTKKNLLGWTASGTDTGGQGWYDLAMCVSPVASSDVYVGGVNIYKSVNTGSEFNITAHWVGTDNAAYVHADQHMLAFNPLNNYLYSCNDGGVYVSKDGGVTWDDLSDGLSILQIYKISASDQTPDLFLSGNQDNGSYKRLNGVWKELAGADGMECWIDPTNDDNIYVSTYYGSFYRSMDGGDTLKYISPADGGQGYWVTPFVINESQPSHIYAAYSDIFKSADRGDTWMKISDKLIGTNVFRSMAVFAGDDNFIYAASATKLFRTTDGGQNWTDITNGLSTAQITSVTISPYDPMKVWVTHTAYLPGEKVYYSDNGGDSWTNYSDGLPNLPVNALIYQKGTNRLLYAGTDLGVYFRNSLMNSWELYNNGMPNVIVNDFDIQYSQGKIIAGTYGRGMWKSPLADAGQPGLFAEIIPPARYSCLGDEVTFSVISSASPDSIVWTFPDGIAPQTKTGPENVSVSFSVPGPKTIGVTVYKAGNSYSSGLNGYFEVLSDVNVNIIPSDTVGFHTGQSAILIASGASEYTWSPTPSLNVLTGNAVVASPKTNETFYVTGTAGSCSDSDSISIAVTPGPVNDDVCSAIVIVPGLNGPFNNFYASVQANEPMPDTTDCNTQITWCSEGGLQASVWFRYVANSNVASFSAKGFDNQIAIYDAAKCEDLLTGNYTLLAANDDYYPEAEFYASAIEAVAVVPGKEYFIQVDGSAGGEQGTFTIFALDFPLGIDKDEVAAKTKVSLYPNPSDGELNIRIPVSPSELKLEVFDDKGQLIQTKIYKNKTSGSFEQKININKKGIFVVRVTGDEIFFVKKVVVQ